MAEFTATLEGGPLTLADFGELLDDVGAAAVADGRRQLASGHALDGSPLPASSIAAAARKHSHWLSDGLGYEVHGGEVLVTITADAERLDAVADRFLGGDRLSPSLNAAIDRALIKAPLIK